MKIDKFTANCFRNLQEIEILPCADMNIICGENAQGKTNIIEAVWLFTGAKSFRGAKDNHYVQMGQNVGKTTVQFVSQGCSCFAEMTFDSKRSCKLEEKTVSSPAKLAEVFHAIVFSPTDLQLVQQGPEVRRKFLDLSIVQSHPGTVPVFREYARAITQRNALLKDLRYDKTVEIMLEGFEAVLVDTGAKIIELRRNYLKELNRFLPNLYGSLSCGRERLTAEYACQTEPHQLAACLKNSRKEDCIAGVTTTGPHRDDVQFFIDGLSARAFGSQGQKRSVALSVKFAQAEVQKKIYGEYPVCLLDDVMSELDPGRRQFILNHVRGWQTFLTCCNPDEFKGLENGRIFTVRAGRIEKA